MGASDSKLVFKKGIFRLSEERHIPADDAYWTSVRQPTTTTNYHDHKPPLTCDDHILVLGTT